MSEELPRDRVLARLPSGVDYAALAAQRFEERKVEHLIAKCGVGKKLWTSARRSFQVDPTARPTLALFCVLFADFPVLLGSRHFPKLHLDPKATLPALFRRAADAPFVRAYAELYEQLEAEANGRAVGLVFNRKGVPGGLVIHDGDLDTYWTAGSMWLVNGGTRQHPRRLIVQPFASMVEAIHRGGHGWRPSLAGA